MHALHKGLGAVVIAVLMITGTTVLFAVVEEQQTIYFRKDHIYAGPGGKEIAIVTPMPSDTIAPTTPSSLSTSSLTATSVVLNWTGSTDSGGSNLAGYKIYRQRGSGANLPVGTVGAGTTTFTESHLQPSNSYNYSIVSFDNAQNHSSPSNVATITTLGASTDTIAPSSPLQLMGSAIDPYNVKLNWLAATDGGGSGLDVYQVKRGTSPTGLAVITTVTTSNLTYTDGTALQNTTYYFAIAAKDKAGNVGPDSNTVTVATPAETISPTTPGNFLGSSLSVSSNRLTWSASTDTGGSGLAGYRVYSSGTLVSGTNPITTTTFDHTGLNRDTNYSYTVTAVDGVGNASPVAGPITVRTLRYNGIDFQDNFNAADGLLSSSWSASNWQILSQRAVQMQNPVSTWVDTYTSTPYTYLRATLDVQGWGDVGLVFGIQDGVSTRWRLYSTLSGIVVLSYDSMPLLGFSPDTTLPLSFRIDADSTNGTIQVSLQGEASQTYNVSAWGIAASTLVGKVGITSKQYYQFVDNFVIWH